MSALKQGDIVFLEILIPRGTKIDHPVVVINNKQVFDEEDFYIGLMLTSDIQDDIYSFGLNNDMLSVPMKKQSEVRCHLIQVFEEKDISGRRVVSSINNKEINKIIHQMMKVTFLPRNTGEEAIL